VTGSSALHRFVLPEPAYPGGVLDLDIVRDNGYRAVLQQLWLVERPVDDDDVPVTGITQPLAGVHLTGLLYEVTGTVSDASAISGVELGIDAGGGIVWRPVSALNNDGSWSYLWSLPGDGVNTLYVRATDAQGNSNPPGAGVAVTVNNVAPAAVTDLVASDRFQDAGSSIDVMWSLSADDGAGVVLWGGGRARHAGDPGDRLA